jgi:lipoprotein-anchoring transpeptidase ErfK/SrfK
MEKGGVFLKYIKVLVTLILLTSAIMVPWVTGEETQITPIMKNVTEPEDNIPEKPKVDPMPKTEPEFFGGFPDNITVLNEGETTAVNIRELPSPDSRSLGVVYGDLTNVEVIEHLDNGYTEVSTRDYITTKPISGFVPTKYIKQIELNQKYGVVVDLNKQKVYVYKDDDVIKTLMCSTGLDDNQHFTPTGFYRIGERGDSFYSHKYKEGAHYWVRFNNNYLFHSVPFDENKKLIEEEAAKLGQKASHGCIRLSVDDARWFYENIPKGTPVIIKD